MDCISYKKGYKYQLVTTYSIEINIKPTDKIICPSEFIILTEQGMLTLKKGYAWDGPSGPTIDTTNFIRASLVHDALYQLMRERLLDKNRYRDTADRLLQSICRQDGMSALRTWWLYKGLRLFGDPAADPAFKRPIKKAPGICV